MAQLGCLETRGRGKECQEFLIGTLEGRAVRQFVRAFTCTYRNDMYVYVCEFIWVLLCLELHYEALLVASLSLCATRLPQTTTNRRCAKAIRINKSWYMIMWKTCHNMHVLYIHMWVSSWGWGWGWGNRSPAAGAGAAWRDPTCEN